MKKPPIGAMAAPRNGTTVEARQSAPDGTFSFTALAAGSYSLTAEAPEFYGSTNDFLLRARQSRFKDVLVANTWQASMISKLVVVNSVNNNAGEPVRLSSAFGQDLLREFSKGVAVLLRSAFVGRHGGRDSSRSRTFPEVLFISARRRWRATPISSAG